MPTTDTCQSSGSTWAWRTKPLPSTQQHLTNKDATSVNPRQGNMQVHLVGSVQNLSFCDSIRERIHFGHNGTGTDVCIHHACILRHRPWYVAAAAHVHKDLVILIDVSRSMNATLDAVKAAVNLVLGTLNPLDRVEHLDIIVRRSETAFVKIIK